MSPDLFAPLGATMEQAVTAVVVAAVACAAAMGVWEWLRAKLISEWDREYR